MFFWARTLLPGTIAAALLLPAGVPLPHDTPRPHTPPPAPAAPTQQHAAAKLTVAPQHPVLDPEAEEFHFTVLLHNLSATPLGKGTITLSLGTVPVESLNDSAVAPADSRTLARLEIDETEAGERQQLEIALTRETTPLLAALRAGVYPLQASFSLNYRVPGDTIVRANPLLTARTLLVWEGIQAAPLPVTLIVPFVLPEEIRTLPNAAELAQHAPPLIELLHAAEQHAATIAVDPRIVAGIRALGTVAPPQAAQLLDRLERSPLPKFLLQFADADPAAQAALGLTELLQPLGFSHAARFGEDDPPPPPIVLQLPQPARPEPLNAHSGAAPLTLPGARPGAWPGTPVDTATLTLLDAADVHSLVLDSDQLTSTADAKIQLDGFDVLISNAPLNLAARATLVADTPAEQAANIAQLTALLALTAQQDSSGVIIALDRGATAAAADPHQVIDAISELPWVAFVPESLHSVGSATLRTPERDDTSHEQARVRQHHEQRLELLRQAMVRSAEIDALAPLLEHPEYLLEYQRERLLDAFATKYASPDAPLDTLDRTLRQHDAELLQGVQLITTERTRLVGTSSRVPITLSNALPFDALVEVHVAPVSAAITVPERDFLTTIPAAGNEHLLVPVHSRISSGESALAITVHSTRSEQSFAGATQPLTLRTTVETIMLTGLGVTAALLFSLGIWRSLRRRRLGVHAG